MQPIKISIKTTLFPAISASVVGWGKDALLLLHGFPATGNLWRKIVPPLAENYKLIIPDMPGVGESLLGAEQVSIDDLAMGMIELLDHLQVEKAIVAGHSMGGYVALAMAAKAPEKILGLSLVHSTAMPDDDEKKATRRKAIALIEKGGKEAFIQTSVNSLFSDNFKGQHKEIVDQQIIESLAIADETLITFYNAMIERPGRIDILQQAGFPVQWIIGANDTVIPKQKGLQQSSLARVSFVSVYTKCGHMSMLEAPEALAKDLTEFAVYCSERKIKDLVK